MALGRISPPSETEEILKLEATQNEYALARIKEILDRSLDKGTAMYGIRVLSRFGFGEEELENIARRFNGRILLSSEPGGLYYGRNPPYITSYIVEHQDGSFETKYIK